ncbi:AAA family ATPase [Desulfoscipio sp. XC116]|uniref:ExeA family protein n=1 Tax=Desulfoscipio sp. XC116 TaxID=3144975 RepID=UPI00325BAC14
MFESFYGLSKTPFSRDIPTDQLYQSLMLDETLGRLEYAARRQLFAVVTGDCGTGKTTTIRLFKASLNPAMFMVMYLADSKLTPRHFYKGLLEQLGCEAKFYRGDAKRKLPHLDRSQVGEYINRHLAYAGAEHDIFSDNAVDQVFRYSSGAVRLVNKVCTHCLLYGAQNGRRIIDDHMVKLVIQGELL